MTKAPQGSLCQVSATDHSVFLACHFHFDLAGNVPLLGDRKNVVHQPVQYQTSREPQEEHRKDWWHQLHDLRLHGVWWCRVQAHLDEHTDAHQNWQDKVRIHLGQIVYPQHERRMAQLHTLEQYPIERNEHRHLHQYRQTATERIDLLPLVQGHHLLGHTLAIITIEFFQAGELWRHSPHFSHGTVAGCRQVEEHSLYQHCQQDDGDTPVTHQAIEPFQDVEQRQGDEEQPAKVDGTVQVRGQGFQTINDLGANVGGGTNLHGLASGNGSSGIDKAHYMQLVPAGGLELGSLVAIRHPGCDEVMLQERQPAIGDRFVDPLLAQITKIVFFVRVVRRTDDQAQIGFDTHGGLGGRVRSFVPNDLAGKVALPVGV